MYGREQRVLLRHYLEQGLTKAELARTLGVSRRTVYHWIETGQLERELDNQALRSSEPYLQPGLLTLQFFRDIKHCQLARDPGTRQPLLAQNAFRSIAGREDLLILHGR